MVKQKVTIINPTGLHLRPAGQFCSLANSFRCYVGFEHRNSVENAKSVLSVLGASVKYGNEITIICDGVDEKEALKAMVELVENGLME